MSSVVRVRIIVALAAGWVGLSAANGRSAPPPASPAQEARALLRAERVGVLATRSVTMDGHPFSSLTPYALDAEGRPLILISTLAEHTKNIQADARVSLFVFDADHPNIHDAPRLTWLGRAVRVPAKDTRARTRYLERFPEAGRFFRAHDFSFYVIEATRGYYIGGFGRIFWIEPGDLVAGP